MKKKVFSIVLLIAVVGLTAYCAYKYDKDGVFEGKSQSIYSYEPFWGISKITIVDHKIAKVDFKIVDMSKNEVFDDKYEKYMEGNQYFINQCRNDWQGVLNYPKKLLETQDINKVDAVAGATWSCNLFKASVREALR